MANLERIYTIPLAGAYEYIRTKRARRAVKLIRAFALRHMKADDAKISEGINSAVFRNGMQKPPRRIKVRIVKGEEGVAKVWLIGEQEKLAEAVKKKEAEKKKASDAIRKDKPEAKKDAAPAKEGEAAKAELPSAKPGAQEVPRPSQDSRAKPAPLQTPRERRDGL